MHKAVEYVVSDASTLLPFRSLIATRKGYSGHDHWVYNDREAPPIANNRTLTPLTSFARYTHARALSDLSRKTKHERCGIRIRALGQNPLPFPPPPRALPQPTILREACLGYVNSRWRRRSQAEQVQEHAARRGQLGRMQGSPEESGGSAGTVRRCDGKYARQESAG